MPDYDLAFSFTVLAIMLGAVLYLGIAVFDQSATTTGAQQDVQITGEPVALQDAGESVRVSSSLVTGTDETVYDSLGFAYRFTGAPDSKLVSDSDIGGLPATNWTVVQGAWVNASATSKNMTVLAMGDPNLVLEYRGNQSTAKWSAWYYDGINSFRSTVDATDPTNASLLFVTRNATTLTIHRNTTAGTNVTVGNNATGQTSINLTASDPYHGRLDETRQINTVLTSSNMSALVSNPVAATGTGNESARILYDRSSPLPIFFAGTDATATNVTLAAGFPGSSLTAGQDYSWESSGPKLTPLSGGVLADAPVAFVDYLRTNTRGTWSKQLQDFIDTSAVVFTVLALVLILYYIRILQPT